MFVLFMSIGWLIFMTGLGNMFMKWKYLLFENNLIGATVTP